MTETFDYIIEHKIQNDLRNKFHQMCAQTRQKILKLFLARFWIREYIGLIEPCFPISFRQPNIMLGVTTGECNEPMD